MGMDDKAENKADEVKGKVKETTGKATDDEQLEAEGKADQSKSSLKQAAENVMDAFKLVDAPDLCRAGGQPSAAGRPARHRPARPVRTTPGAPDAPGR